MRLPEVGQLNTTTMMMSEFGGLDLRARIAEGSMVADDNLTADGYPVLCGRRLHATVDSGAIHAIAKKDAIIEIKGSDIYVNSLKVSGITVSVLEGAFPKQIVGMGALAVIFPDKIWINTQDTTKYGHLEQTNAVTAGSVTFTPCDGAGTPYEIDPDDVSDTPPASPTEGTYWIDTSSVPHGLYRWSATTGEWVGISATYIKISAANIGKGLAIYDGVTISGITITDESVEEQLEGLNGDGHIVYGCGDDHVIVAGILDKIVTETQTMSIARKVPDMDYVCELDNRLWGCRYGLVNGEVVNEICASALGDPKVWDRYLGGSTDSYRVSVGSDGQFTAICAHMGYVLAWKENCLHKIYGTMPSNFQLATINCEGVEQNSWQSVTDVEGVLYYKGRTHVLAYDGSMPQSVGDALGRLTQTGGSSYAAGGAWGHVWYLSMSGITYTYDTRQGIWHQDCAKKLDYFVKTGDGLLCRETPVSGDKKVVDVRAVGYIAGTEEAPYTWKAVFGPTGYELPGRKYLSRYNIRCAVPAGQWIRIYFRYDARPDADADPWHGWIEAAHVEGHGEMNTLMIPVRPRRCDHVQMGIEAGPGVMVYSIARILGVGGDGK